MGCFGVERLFWELPGVYSTASLYRRLTPNPTYREVCPAILAMPKRCIVYDPSVISYEQLLRILGESRSAQGMRQAMTTAQYRSAIYPLTPEQDAAAPVWNVSGGDACRR